MTRNLELFASTPLEYLIEDRPGVLLQIDEVQISLRSHNALMSEGFRHVGDLIQKTEQKLLRIPNFGRKSLKEVVDVLGHINLSLGDDFLNWPPNDISLLRKKYSKEITELKENLYLLAHKVSASCLEEELFNIANLNNDRNGQIFMQRMGWDGKGGKTLDAIGKRYGMTRERVRQICEKLEKPLKIIVPPTKFLKQAILHVNQSIPKPSDEIEKELADEGISQEPFRVEGLLTAAALLGGQSDFAIEKVGRKKTRLVVHEDSIGIPKLIIQQTRRHTEHWGACTINDLTYAINAKSQCPINDEYTQMVLVFLEEFRWLDKETGWFWLIDNKRNRIRNLIQKIVSVADELTIDELRNGIMRPYRMRGYSPPKRVLKEILRQSGYKVENNLIVADTSETWEEVLKGTNAFALVRTLKDFGPVMTRSDFEKLCIGNGMNKTSFYMYIGASPLIQRYSRSVYGLRGARISSPEIEQLRRKVEIEEISNPVTGGKAKVLIDYGWTKKGRIWVGYRLSDSSVSSGVVSTPSRMQSYIDGEFNLYSIDKQLVGNIRSNQGSTWGFGPFFRRRGCEADDFMVVIYDLKSRLATAELGDEDLIERFSLST